MSDVIKLLPDSVANQIAAGEVIQRPASVIKELVENAIDADAKSIQIILKDAGRTLIQVVDDGKGMSATDARLAFERHSTSKIRKANDLFTLHTMGFRGEALASIAAISQLELRTAREEDQIGTKICISASKCESQEPDVCPVGSNFMIKNIFFNVPARRKFLKSNQVELSNIMKEFEKLALVNHMVEFSVVHNDTVMYKLFGGTLKQRIISIFGHALESQLIPINLDTTLIKIEGFIGRPENARKRNYLQYFFVNGRYMRHPYFHKAVMSSYGELIPDDSQPNYFLNFKVDPESIDVNIHPTKTEIKFENEAPIWQIISAAIKESLGRFSAVPSIDFDMEGAPEMPAFSHDKNFVKPKIDLDPSYNPFENNDSLGKPSARFNASVPSASKNWDILYENFAKSKMDTSEDGIEEAPSENENVDVESRGNKQELTLMPSSFNGIEETETHTGLKKSIFQLKGRYILSIMNSGLMVVDQHRAHIRVLYDKYMGQMTGANIVSQGVMFPEVLHLSPAQNAILEEVADEMNVIGFNLAKLGSTDWSINGIPVGLENVEMKDVVLQAIEDVEEGGSRIKDKICDRLAMSVSRSGAIVYGRVLSEDEMDSLLCDLLRLPEPNYTPDGKKIITVMSLEQIDKMF